MIADREEVRRNYPDMLSLEDVRSILHISKRKAAWMLQNGFIKCEIRHNKTKQYKVRIENLFIYLDKVERGDSSVQIPIGIFNAKKPSGKEKKERFRSNPMRLKKPTKAFREWLTDKLGERERNTPYKRYFAPYRLHTADCATMDEARNASKR